MLWRGFKFGLLLQIAIGPVCVLVLNSAISQGFWAGMSVAAAVCLVDAAYIALAGGGAAALLDKPAAQRWLPWFSALVLALFGADLILSALGHGLFGGLSLFSGQGTGSLFLQGLLLTASSPLTIVFWGGVFAGEVAGQQLRSGRLLLFGCGCVAATAVFLTAISALAGALAPLISPLILRVLNGAVGLVLIGFGISRVVKKKK